MPAKPVRRIAHKQSHKPTQAERADRYVLYQNSVQDADWEIDFMTGLYKGMRGRSPKRLREDFCGTGLFSCAWVKSAPDREAVGVDLDPEVLAWSRAHNLPKLKPAALKRLELVQADVMGVKAAPADIVCAFNFSYWIFKERAALRRYFENVRPGLKADGIFMLDAFGGYDAGKVLKEREDMGRFTYIWDQAEYDPVTGSITCHIHYAFPDGSRLKQAFSYHWRLWTLPELQEILAEAGFHNVRVWWQGTDPKTGEGSDEFTPVEHGDPDPSWIAYIVAEK
ncbi:MAG TPA: class I SAM-dependent methyltransferase [Gammaproteobacteria bacterium]|jgi:SAM-dependent methyltransferase